MIDEYAQQVATEEGVSSNGASTTYEPSALASASEYDAEGVSQTIEDTVDTTPKSYIDNATSTVASQLDSLLASDSSYIQQAKNRALETSQARGWGGSTMMEEAGQKAAIASALPIAQADASTYAQSDLSNQSFQQGLATNEASAITQGALSEQAYAFEGMEAYLDRQHEAGVLEDKQAFESQQATFDRAQASALQNDNQEYALNLEAVQAQNKVALQEIANTQETLMTNLELDAENTQAFSSGSSQIMHDYLTSVESLMTDPSFLELSGLDLENTVNNLQTFAMNQMSFLGSIYQETDIDAWIDSAFPPVTEIG